jgi:hypothetical protein
LALSIGRNGSILPQSRAKIALAAIKLQRNQTSESVGRQFGFSTRKKSAFDQVRLAVGSSEAILAKTSFIGGDPQTIASSRSNERFGLSTPVDIPDCYQISGCWRTSGNKSSPSAI